MAATGVCGASVHTSIAAWCASSGPVSSVSFFVVMAKTPHVATGPGSPHGSTKEEEAVLAGGNREGN